MGIRKIKAHEAFVEGEFVKVVKRSRRKLGLVIGTILGFLGGMWLADNIAELQQYRAISVISVSIFCGFLGILLFSGEEVRRIPKADLVEIKTYTWPTGVTVVLDDERTTRGRLAINTTSQKKE